MPFLTLMVSCLFLANSSEQLAFTRLYLNEKTVLHNTLLAKRLVTSVTHVTHAVLQQKRDCCAMVTVQ